MYEIGVEHSRAMAEGTVPFGHQGFNDRVRRFPFHNRSAAENVAWNHGHADVARTAVDGWIKSPGHEKNLRGNFLYCAIGVYEKSNGAWYLTQLFALP